LLFGIQSKLFRFSVRVILHGVFHGCVDLLFAVSAADEVTSGTLLVLSLRAILSVCRFHTVIAAIELPITLQKEISTHSVSAMREDAANPLVEQQGLYQSLKGREVRQNAMVNPPRTCAGSFKHRRPLDIGHSLPDFP
jgi:hypothetical protein